MTSISKPQGRPHWLVVDDDPTTLDITTLILQIFTTADILPFNDPLKALEAFETAPDYFDLLVTDLHMPALDGLQLSRAVHARSPKVRSVLVTGSSGLWSETGARNAGFDALVLKPYTIDDLTGAIRKIPGCGWN